LDDLTKFAIRKDIIDIIRIIKLYEIGSVFKLLDLNIKKLAFNNAYTVADNKLIIIKI
jgi:hypothetical protein